MQSQNTVTLHSYHVVVLQSNIHSIHIVSKREISILNNHVVCTRATLLRVLEFTGQGRNSLPSFLSVATQYMRTFEEDSVCVMNGTGLNPSCPNTKYIVASELKDPIWHSSEWQMGSFSSEALSPITVISHNLTSAQKTIIVTANSANRRRWSNIGLMLDQRRRWLANINPTLGRCLVFAEPICWNPGYGDLHSHLN